MTEVPVPVPAPEPVVASERVTARFWVDELTTRAYNPDHCHVTLRPVSRGEENRAWAQATPAGEIKLTITNPSAAAFFQENQGKDVAITFAALDAGRFTDPHGTTAVP